MYNPEVVLLISFIKSYYYKYKMSTKFTKKSLPFGLHGIMYNPGSTKILIVF